MATNTRPIAAGAGPSFDGIIEKARKDKQNNVLATSYPLGWKPEGDQTRWESGGDIAPWQMRVYKSVMRIEGTCTSLDLKALDVMSMNVKEDTERRKEAKELLVSLRSWMPQNVYWGPWKYYNTKKKDTGTFNVNEEMALKDYQGFADEVNKKRKNPIRTIVIRETATPDGRIDLTASWTITRWVGNSAFDYHHFVRKYQVVPKFKFYEGTTLASLEEEEIKEGHLDEYEKLSKEMEDKFFFNADKYATMTKEERKIEFERLSLAKKKAYAKYEKLVKAAIKSGATE
jgi:hypothetical protein